MTPPLLGSPKPPDTQPQATDRSSKAYWLLSLLLWAVIISTWYVHPALIFDVESGFHEAASAVRGPMQQSGPATSQQTLLLPQREVDYLNRIFRERENEIAYCGIVTDGTLVVRLAETTRAGREFVEFSTDSCPTDQAKPLVVIHTHPSGDPQLSPTDRQVLLQTAFDVSCVQAGPISAEPGSVTKHLRCVEAPDPPDIRRPFPRVSVVVEA